MNLAVIHKEPRLSGGVSRQVAARALRIFDWLELRGLYHEFDSEMRQAHQALRAALIKDGGATDSDQMKSQEWSELRRLASQEFSKAAGSLGHGGAGVMVPLWAQLVAKLEAQEEIPVMSGAEVVRVHALSYEVAHQGSDVEEGDLQDVSTDLVTQPSAASAHVAASEEQARSNAVQISPDEARAKIFSQLCATKLWDDGGTTDSTLAGILAETLGSQEAAAQAIGLLAAASAKAVC